MSLLTKGRILYPPSPPDLLSKGHLEQVFDGVIVMFRNVPTTGDVCTTRPEGGFVPPISAIKGKVVG